MADADGTFIEVEVSGEAATDPEIAKKLEEVCPVDIFKAAGEGVQIVRENLDECVLCELCLDAAPAGHRRRQEALRRDRAAPLASAQQLTGAGSSASTLATSPAPAPQSMRPSATPSSASSTSAPA